MPYTTWPKNFTRSEFELSNTAIRHGIDNKLPPLYKSHAILTAHWLQILRDRLSKCAGREVIINISSGYRCQKLNSLIKGSKNSAHCRGLAADISASGISPRELFRFIKTQMKDVGYDQAINEFDSWVHISILVDKRNERHEDLIATRVPKRFGRPSTIYERSI